jgi:hypothetical protein
MTEGSPAGPVLFCFDGSEGSRNALRAAGQLVSRPVEAVVLTVWETIETRLALAGGSLPVSRSTMPISTRRRKPPRGPWPRRERARPLSTDIRR